VCVCVCVCVRENFTRIRFNILHKFAPINSAVKQVSDNRLLAAVKTALISQAHLQTLRIVSPYNVWVFQKTNAPHVARNDEVQIAARFVIIKSLSLNFNPARRRSFRSESNSYVTKIAKLFPLINHDE